MVKVLRQLSVMRAVLGTDKRARKKKQFSGSTIPSIKVIMAIHYAKLHKVTFMGRHSTQMNTYTLNISSVTGTWSITFCAFYMLWKPSESFQGNENLLHFLFTRRKKAELKNTLAFSPAWNNDQTTLLFQRTGGKFASITSTYTYLSMIFPLLEKENGPLQALLFYLSDAQKL